MKQTEICSLLGIRYPIIQGGMIWASGHKLASACANAGILGLIGAGSMPPELLRQHIKKAKENLLEGHQGNLGVNVPLLYSRAQEQIEVALAEGIKIFFTSAGAPKAYTAYLKSRECVVVHVCSSPELAIKCEQAGVDAVVAEGFEAGGHNGRDEITTLCLIPQVVDAVKIPVIAAGGIGDGRAIAACIVLGASGVQLGSRFVATKESSVHENFKQALLNVPPGGTDLSLKKLVPVRLLKNHFYRQVKELEDKAASKEELELLLGKGRAKKGMFEGDLEEGELEIGQISSTFKDLPSVQQLVQRLLHDYKKALDSLT